MGYPVTVRVEPKIANRNRMTTAFRLVLAIPHMILVGGAFGLGLFGASGFRTFGSGGLLGAVAYFLAVVSWFTILIGGTHIGSIRQFSTFYLRWRVRALSYLTLLEDAYPPFGDEPYPASIDVVDPVGPRDRVTIAFRIILAIPHFIALVFLGLIWCGTTVIAWFAILFNGVYPPSLYGFGVDTLAWLMRVDAYMLLLVDEYPPFVLDSGATSQPLPTTTAAT